MKMVYSDHYYSCCAEAPISPVTAEETRDAIEVRKATRIQQDVEGVVTYMTDQGVSRTPLHGYASWESVQEQIEQDSEHASIFLSLGFEVRYEITYSYSADSTDLYTAERIVSLP